MDQRARVFLLLSLVFAFFAHGYLGANDASRFALTASLAEDATYEIGDHLEAILSPDYHLVDYSVYEGRIFSDKAPIPAILAVPVYLLLRLLTDNHNILAYFIVVLFSALTTALVAFMLHDLIGIYTQDRNTRVFILLSFALGTSALYYSGVFFSHALVTFLGVAAFYLLFLSRDSRARERSLLAGALAGLSIGCDYYAGLTLIGLLYYSALLGGGRWKHLLLASIPPIMLLAGYHYLIFGDPLATPYHHQGSFVARHQQELAGGFYPTTMDLFNLLLGRRYGLLLYNPILILGFIGLGLGFKGGARAETKAAALLVVLYLLFNISIDQEGYGAAWGPRYMTPIFPFLCLAMANIKWNRTSKIVAAPLLLISLAINLGAANLSHPPRPRSLHPSPILDYLIPQSLSGEGLVVLDRLWGDGGKGAHLLSLACLFLYLIAAVMVRPRKLFIAASATFGALLLVASSQIPAPSFQPELQRELLEDRTLVLWPPRLASYNVPFWFDDQRLRQVDQLEVEGLLSQSTAVYLPLRATIKPAVGLNLEMLRRDFSPREIYSAQDAPGSRETIVIWRRGGDRAPPPRHVEAPSAIETRYYLERHRFFRGAHPVVSERLVEARGQAVAQPFLAPTLRGAAPGQVPLLPPRPIPWPLDRSHLQLSEGALVYEIYVDWIGASTTRVHIDTHAGDETIAFSTISFDLASNTTEELTVYSRISEPILDSFIENYQLREIDEARFHVMKRRAEEVK